MIRKIGLMMLMIPITSGTQPPENDYEVKPIEISPELKEQIEIDSIKMVNDRKRAELKTKEIEYVKSYFERDSLDKLKKPND